MTRVLVVDDERKMRRVLQILLEQMGLESIPVDSAEAALDHFGGEKIDLVLTDLKMPGMSGIDLLARIRALDPAGLLATVRKHGITMCGAAPVAAMLWAAKALGAQQCELVQYTHSGAVTGDDSQVVGYAGLVVR